MENKEWLAFIDDGKEYSFLTSLYDSFFDGTLIVSYRYGDLVVEIANMEKAKLINCVLYDGFDKDLFLDEYPKNCYRNLTSYYSKALSKLIIYDITEVFEEENNQRKELYSVVKEWLKYFVAIQKICIEVCNYYFNNINEVAVEVQNIRTSFYINKDSNSLNMIYYINNLMSIISIEACKIQACKVIIRQCENCKKFFIPQTRTDEIYCQNIFKDGKTCKDIGYELKIRKDKFMSAYRTAYKSMKARESRIDESGRQKYNQRYTEKWVEAVKVKMELYKSSDDIEGFNKFLKESMQRYKPQKGDD